jgi:hypothetical protein
LFEALDFLSYLRSQVIGPLALAASGARPSGVRKIEKLAPDFTARLVATVAIHDRSSCISALQAAVALYLELREPRLTQLNCDEHTRSTVMAYLAKIATA